MYACMRMWYVCMHAYVVCMHACVCGMYACVCGMYACMRMWYVCMHAYVVCMHAYVVCMHACVYPIDCPGNNVGPWFSAMPTIKSQSSPSRKRKLLASGPSSSVHMFSSCDSQLEVLRLIGSIIQFLQFRRALCNVSGLRIETHFDNEVNSQFMEA
jgi:hypothetical protein